MKKTLFLSAILGAALCSSAFADTPLVEYTTTVGETTYAGAVLEYKGDADTGISTATYLINKSGTTYECPGNNTNPNLGAEDNRLWTYTTLAFGNGNHGHTLALTGVNGKTITITSDWSNQKFTLGGVITALADGATSGAYVVNGKCGDFVLVGNATSGVNMNIGANTTLKTTTNNTVEVQTAGTWNIEEGKSLTLEGGRFWINGANTVTLSGGGTLKFNISNTNKIQLDANSGFDITGGTTVEMGNGLSCQFGTGAGFTSTDGTGKVNYVVTTTEVVGSTNGFSTNTYAAPGNLSIGSGVTLLLNGAAATLSDGTISASSTIYHVVADAAFNKDSMSSYTAATGFQIHDGATLRITEKTTNNNGIIKGDVVVKSGGVLQLEANDALGWSGNNVKSLLVENGAEVKLTHSSNETFGGALTLQGNAKITGDNARWDFFTDSSITVAANATAAINTNGLQLRHAGSQATITLGNNATLAIGANITNGDRGDSKLVITANNGSGSIVNLNGGANGVGLQFAGVTVNINKDMTVNQLMLSKNNALTTVNVAAGKTLTITGTTMPTSNGSFELANWARNNVLNIEGTVIANSGITTEGGSACPVVNIKNGGTLTMNAGLAAVRREGGSGFTTINVESGATLNMGGTAELANTDLITVNVKDGATLGGAYGSGNAVVINKNLVLADNATVTMQTAAEKALTLNGTFSNATASVIAQGGGSLTLANTAALSALTIKDNTTVTFSGETALGSALTLGSGAALVNSGTLTFNSAMAVTANTTSSESAPLSGNGYGTLTYSSTILSGTGTSNAASVTWTLNGTAATYANGTLSYSTQSDEYYIVENAASKMENDVTILHLNNGATITDSEFEVSDFVDVAANKTFSLTGSTMTATGDQGVWIHDGSVINLDSDSKIVVDGLTVTGGTITKGENGKDAAQMGTHGDAAFHRGVVLTGASITVDNGSEQLREYTISGGSVTVASNAETTINSALSSTTALTVNSGSTANLNAAGTTAAAVTVNGDLTVKAASTVKQLGGLGTVKALADLTVTEAEEGKVTLGGMEIAGNTTVTVNDHAGTLTLGSLTVTGSGSTINANLDLSGATVTLNGNSVELGCDLKFDGTAITLSDDDIAAISGAGLLLFSDVESLTLGTTTHTTDYIGLVDASGIILTLAGDATSALPDKVFVNFSATDKTVSLSVVPEPATATLSLLALAALASRRRRK